MIDIKLENSEIIEKGLIALGGKLRKNKKKISSKVLKPSAKVVEKVMKSYAPVMTKYKAFNVYRTPKLNSGMRAPKGMGKIYVSIKPRQLRNSIGSFQTKAAKNSPYMIIAPKFKFGVWTKPEKGGWYMQMVQAGTDTVRPQPFVGRAYRGTRSGVSNLLRKKMSELVVEEAKQINGIQVG
jgi:HK97 gp10 family phage protein